jgi:hypothetical protein
MASSPNPLLRRRAELIIRVAAPLLDLSLAAGGLVSRVLSRKEPGYMPARMPSPGEAAPRSLRPRA